MPFPQAAGQLLTEAVHALGLGAARPYPGGRAWQVGSEGDTTLDVEYDVDGHAFVISADIGPVAEHARLALYELLLQYNFVWTQSGGVRMALDPSTGRIVAIGEVPDRDLSVPQLSTALSNMELLRQAWTEIVRGGGTRESTASQMLPEFVRA